METMAIIIMWLMGFAFIGVGIYVISPIFKYLGNAFIEGIIVLMNLIENNDMELLLSDVAEKMFTIAIIVAFVVLAIVIAMCDPEMILLYTLFIGVLSGFRAWIMYEKKQYISQMKKLQEISEYLRK